MAILDFDDILTTEGLYPDSFEFGIVTTTLVTTSSINGHSKTSALPGARWRLRMSFEDKTQEDLRALMAFLIELQGPAGRFKMYDLANPKGAGVTPDSANMIAISTGDYVTFGTPMGLVPGDYFSIEKDSAGDELELKMVTQVGNELSGQYRFRPATRENSVNYAGKTAIFNKPSGIFALTSDDQVYWSTSGKIPVSSIDIEATEIF